MRLPVYAYFPFIYSVGTAVQRIEDGRAGQNLLTKTVGYVMSQMIRVESCRVLVRRTARILITYPELCVWC